MVDCGVTVKTIKEEDVYVCFITHRHTDHWKKSAVNFLLNNGVRVIAHKLNKSWFQKNYKRWQEIEYVNYGGFDFTDGIFKTEVKLNKVPHNVPNVALHINIRSIMKDDEANEFNIFHATDCGNLNGILAKNYEIYAIETNYTLRRLNILEANAIADGKFNRFKRVKRDHLEDKQAFKFLSENKGDRYLKFIRLHQSPQTLVKKIK